MDASSVITKTKKSATAYGRGFEQMLIDNGIYIDNRAHNIEEIKKRLAQQNNQIRKPWFPHSRSPSGSQSGPVLRGSNSIEIYESN